MEIKQVKTKRRGLKKGQIELLGMTLPSVMFIAVFSYLPLSGWLYAFFDYRLGYPLFKCDFVGLANIKYAFGNPYILTVLANTLIMSALCFLSLPISCAIAILLSEVRGTKFRKSVQTIITLPNFIGWIIVYSICFALFSQEGLLTSLFSAIAGRELKSLLANPSTAKGFMAFLDIWKGTGYGSIVFFAAITGIDPELYDASKVDGAGRWQKIKYITLPCLIPTLVVLSILRVGSILNSGFDQYYCFINPIIKDKLEVLDYYVYQLGMKEGDIPLSTAVSMCKTFVSVILVYSVNKFAKKVSGQSIV